MFASNWYVNGSIAESRDGTAPKKPFKTIQEGINAAWEGGTVIVAKGIYVENIVISHRDIVLRSTNPLDSDVVAKTIIDGNQSGSVIILCSYRNGAILGFTIRNGNAEKNDDYPVRQRGGGITTFYGGNEGFTIQNNLITNNLAIRGGGLYSCNGDILGNTIINNSADDFGGGLCDCNGTIQGNTISDNSADFGAGLCDCDGPIQNNTISGNSAEQDGGGLYRCSRVQNNIITENSADSGGGLADCPFVQNNLIVGNSARDGGGLFNGLRVRNNIICRNSAEGGGGGVYNSIGAIENNIISNNSAGGKGGGLYHCNDTIQNCIIWRNEASQDSQLHESTIPTYSCIQDWDGDGEGNIEKDPRFVDLDGPDDNPETYEDNNFRLLPDSPCIDAGINVWFPGFEMDGNLRVAFGRDSLTVDMGAYEYNAKPFVVTQVILTENGGLQLIWNSQPKDHYSIYSGHDPIRLRDREAIHISSQGQSTGWIDRQPTGKQKFYRITTSW